MLLFLFPRPPLTTQGALRKPMQPNVFVSQAKLKYFGTDCLNKQCFANQMQGNIFDPMNESMR